MNKSLENSKKNQLKVKKPITGELNNKETFLLTPKWLEEWEKEEQYDTIKNKARR